MRDDTEEAKNQKAYEMELANSASTKTPRKPAATLMAGDLEKPTLGVETKELKSHILGMKAK